MLIPGDKTDFGIVGAVLFIEGERYYLLTDKFNTVSMLPAYMI